MKYIYIALFLFLFIGTSTNSFAGETTTINVSFSTSTMNISAGDQVVFSWNGNASQCCSDCGDITYAYDITGGTLIGGNAEQIIPTSSSPTFPTDITVQYDSPGSFTPTLTATRVGGGVECNINNSPFTGSTIVVAAPIPTLSQWGLIILGLIFLVAGIVRIRKSDSIPVIR